MNTNSCSLAIIGIVGVPGNYGGFETLVDNLLPLPFETTVFCSSRHYASHRATYKSASLQYIPLNANGVSSIFYDAVSLFLAARRKVDVCLALGVSGALFFPVLRFLYPRMSIVVNVDGIEWRRQKWTGPARWLLKLSEKIAVRSSNVVIADNQGISDYLSSRYGRASEIIAYGGDHALAHEQSRYTGAGYALSICRIEPENNIRLILTAFAETGKAIKFVGNWRNSGYGMELLSDFKEYENIELLDPVYDVNNLAKLRSGCDYYVHGHSAGGTNPSLVEIMHFGKPVLSFDCIYNRYTLKGLGAYFSDTNSLSQLLQSSCLDIDGAAIRAVALKYYRWTEIRSRYVDLLNKQLKREKFA